MHPVPTIVRPLPGLQILGPTRLSPTAMLPGHPERTELLRRGAAMASQLPTLLVFLSIAVAIQAAAWLIRAGMAATPHAVG